MTVRPWLHPSTFGAVITPAPTRPARARIGRWPFDDDIAHLVLVDHHMVPAPHDIEGWLDDAAASGARVIRTGALFPNAVPAFLAADFTVADTLTLLTSHLDAPSSPPPAARPTALGEIRLRRLRPTMLHEAAEIDRRSFSAPWANDTTALAEIMTATPYHRSRSVHLGGRMVAFSISGRADRAGYVQRLAVDPSARRRGLARLLLDDARRWMHRRNVDQVMVNTAADNHGALTLYRSMGFTAQPESLLILERALR